LVIANVSDADAAIYSAVVSDAYSSVTTSNATLTVNDSLFIATQPLSQTIGVGSNVTFTATAYGAPPFIFQWYYGYTNITPTVITNRIHGRIFLTADQILAGEKQLLKNLSFWIEWCDQHPSGGTFSDADSKTINVPAEMISPVRAELQKHRDHLQSKIGEGATP
jgi:exopolysaccharide biosynthesis predicted pyruvyltransferase EpsI